MINCGIDIIEISRIESAIAKTSGFLEKVFSKVELDYYTQNGCRTETLAGFFAAKEAFSKFLGTGLSGLGLTEISVAHTSSGSPFITYRGAVLDLSLSISHNKTTAVAVVCGDLALTQSGLDSCSDQYRLEMKSLIPHRPLNSNKGDFGRILVIAGSQSMSGAGALSAFSALRSGAGLVTLATEASAFSIAAGFYPEVMTKALPSKNGCISAEAIPEILTLSQNTDVIVFGPGLGKGADIHLILKELLRSYTKTLIIDADGLNALSCDLSILKGSSCQVILTPHPGEMSRLTQKTIAYIQANRTQIAEALSKEYGVCIALKGYGTVVAAHGFNTFINPTGNPALATAGTGDVLSGVIAALSGQGLDSFDATRLGVYLHGLAGDVAADTIGIHSVVASDIINSIPKAFKIIKNYI